ncbi:MAG TPA: DUF362 domain-containing protein [bacterium]|nr:DUF362 domain-containing protein [bacterium]
MTSQVAIRKCDDYDYARVTDAVHATLSSLGGIGAYIRSGQKVLIKPNMLSAKSPDRAVTTHPAVLEAVIREAQQAGGEVRVGDSPSAVFRGLARYWEATGYRAVAERTGVPLLNFEAGGTIARMIDGSEYHLARHVLEADVVINLPKMKTHGLTLYTGAVKNLYGCLPGFQKARYHKLYPKPEDFSRVLVDIYTCIRPVLTVMDAVFAMEGNGPSTGSSRRVGLILASADGIALDAVANRIMGYKPGEVHTTRIAGERGVGESDLDRIRIGGPGIESVALSDFVLPPTHLLRWVPRGLVRWAGRFLWVKPRTDVSRCTGCGVCARACPVRAIEMKDGLPVTDYDLCINCMCCNESCPEGAVYQEMSWLARRFS